MKRPTLALIGEPAAPLALNNGDSLRVDIGAHGVVTVFVNNLRFLRCTTNVPLKIELTTPPDGA